MNTLRHHKPNELAMALRVAMKVLDQAIEQKPKGGLIVNKGQDIEAKMSYQEARLCLERIQDTFALKGAFSFGICGECTHWQPQFFTGKNENLGKCGGFAGNTKYRYDCCNRHSRENGGYGL